MIGHYTRRIINNFITILIIHKKHNIGSIHALHKKSPFVKNIPSLKVKSFSFCNLPFTNCTFGELVRALFTERMPTVKSNTDISIHAYFTPEGIVVGHGHPLNLTRHPKVFAEHLSHGSFVNDEHGTGNSQFVDVKL